MMIQERTQDLGKPRTVYRIGEGIYIYICIYIYIYIGAGECNIKTM